MQLETRLRTSAPGSSQRPAFGQDLIGRADDVQRVSESVNAGGAVLVGPHGIGKTAVLRAAAAASPGFTFIQVRGTTAAANAPYGALAWLISELPREVVNNPVLVLRGLKELLVERAAGKRPVLVLDNSDELDELAVMVATQLCRQGTAALLLATPALSACAPELARLWSDGLLRRIDLGPLDRGATGVLVHRTAAAPPTAAALETVWRYSRGNPLAIELMTRSQLEAGRFRIRGGFCAQAGPASHAGELAEAVERRLRRLTAAQRDAVDLLALSDELPLPLLMVLTGSNTVDELQEMGYLTVRNQVDVLVRLNPALPGPLLQALVPPGRQEDLLARFAPHLGLEERTDSVCLAVGRWMAACGQALSPDLLHRALREGRRRGDLPAVRDLAAAAGIPLPRGSAVELATALLQAGCPQDALDVAAEAIALPASGADPSADMRLRLVRLQASMLLEEHHEADPGDLAPQPPIAGPGEAEPPSLALTRVGILHRRGEWEAAAEQLARATLSPNLDEDERLAAGVHQVCSLTVRGARAMTERAEALLHGLPDSKAGDIEREQAFLELSFALLLAGRPQLVLDAGRRAALQLPQDPHHPGGGLWEVPAGLAHLLAGRADAALRVLLPAHCQLKMLDPHGLLPLAAAAAGAAGRRSAGAAVPAFRGTEDQGPTALVLAGTLTEHFQAAGQGRNAGQSLHRLGLRNLEEGNLGSSLLNLTASVLRGESAALADLGTAAAAAGEDAGGNIFADFSRNISGSHPLGLADVAGSALDAGHAELAYFAATAARRLAADRGERPLARRVKNLENQAYRQLADANRVEEVLDRLSDFERNLLLRAAAGESSSSLGRDLHLSPRTVDWHLGRLFRRLHISGRGELRDLLAEAAVGEWLVPSAVP